MGISRKILVVEDSYVSHRILKSSLTRQNFEVFQSFDGSDAIAQMQKNGDDLDMLWVDLGLPCVSGVKVLEYAIKNYPKTKLCCISAKTDEDTMDSIKEMGCKYFLPKPFSRAELDEMIVNMLDEEE